VFAIQQRESCHSGEIQDKSEMRELTSKRLITLDPPQSLSTAFLGHFQELATNPFGCRVIQKMIEQLGDDMKRQILDEMHPISAMLMQDQFGSEPHLLVHESS
jgi:hypothetical protein